jgi:uncharacterized protein Usg
MNRTGCLTLWEKGYRLTFAEIEVSDPPVCEGQAGYTRTLLWQDLDVAPNFPVLSSFLEDWRIGHTSSEVASVKIAVLEGVEPDDLAQQQFSLGIH